MKYYWSLLNNLLYRTDGETVDVAWMNSCTYEWRPTFVNHTNTINLLIRSQMMIEVPESHLCEFILTEDSAIL